MEEVKFDGYGPQERAYKFADRDDRIVKVIWRETTAETAEDTQAVQRSFKAFGFRVNPDGSLVYPDKPLTLQPGYYCSGRGVMREAVANDALSLGNEIGGLLHHVAKTANAIAITAASFNTV